MIATALMVGGPNDGAVIELHKDQPVVILAQPDLAAEWRLGDDGLMSRAMETTTYTLGRLHLFGVEVTIGVASGLTEAARDRLLRTHLLTPVARNLMESPA